VPAIVRQADIVVAAIGKPRFITADMVKPGAVVIDVGINRVPDATKKTGYRIVGDVDFDAVSPQCEAITPVPGGVGPMTVAMLMKNTLDACERAKAQWLTPRPSRLPRGLLVADLRLPGGHHSFAHPRLGSARAFWRDPRNSPPGSTRTTGSSVSRNSISKPSRPARARPGSGQEHGPPSERSRPAGLRDLVFLPRQRELRDDAARARLAGMAPRRPHAGQAHLPPPHHRAPEAEKPGFLRALLRSAWKAAFFTLPNPFFMLLGIVNFHVPLFRRDKRAWQRPLDGRAGRRRPRGLIRDASRPAFPEPGDDAARGRPARCRP
jgi:hypothetical protein